MWLDLNPRAPACTIDQSHMAITLLNVLKDAREAEAMPGEGVDTVSTQRLRLNGEALSYQLQPGEYAVVSICDDGTGMSLDVLERGQDLRGAT